MSRGLGKTQIDVLRILLASGPRWVADAHMRRDVPRWASMCRSLAKSYIYPGFSDTLHTVWALTPNGITTLGRRGYATEAQVAQYMAWLLTCPKGPRVSALANAVVRCKDLDFDE